ncbi:uncharacterized protein EDB91DRAFT_1086380 [Suillus paluster]|uniref:uncharacterized protein n=1 Tax=Suillus paluster TaxID=48578 RepID=UPI001B885B8A|nr:uncharacterized protein EDB91DRAFT_1086380 [Suillus paluster]KAG1727579.1 hypothetical protein EDB91DRAFT_1086380 [Suillus paluster]
MTTSGNGCQGRNHISITSWIEKLHQKIGDASSAIRMGSINVKIVLGSHSIAQAVAWSQYHCNPFHWISQWNGQFFEKSCLAHVGLIIYLGHDGKQCPVVMDRWDLFDEDEQEDHFEPEDLPSVSGPKFQPKENTMVIVDKSGVHHLQHLSNELLQQASANDLKRVSTPCSGNPISTSSEAHYIDKALCKDRYRELMRVARQWRQLKSMKWHGFGHRSDNPNARDLALFCLACPQPGINISLSGDESLDDWSFVMDGNFKAEHLHPIKLYDEVWLSDGLGFMVRKERQMNMDYALCEAAQHNMDGITRAVTFYDINCQYNKHLHVRVDQNQFLTMVPELTVIPRIGLWHIHGHQDSWYVRYVSNFIEGIGCIDGEIMETLWACLNLISPAAQGMSSLHWKECLAFQMNDSNFCKMICMKRTLCQKYKQAKNGIAKSGKAFDRLDKAAPANLKTDWLASERIAQSNRIQDPAVMDIYEINIEKGKITLSRSKSEFILNPALSKKEIELRLLQEGNAHHAAPSRRSVATWISMGLAIEEAQIALLIEVQRIGKRTTKTQRLDISQQCNRLQGHIDAFTQTALMHLGEGYDAENDPDDLNIDILDDLDDDLEDFIGTSDTWTNSPELTVIPLPSNLGVTSVHQAVSLHASIYTKTRKQMIKLEPGQDQLQKYKPLLQEQLKNEKFYHVHWLWAKALRDQWKEELILVELEMDWTCNFFLWKSTQWGDQMRESLVKRLLGHACYSGRQSQMYSSLAQDAQAAFQDLQSMLIDAQDE